MARVSSFLLFCLLCGTGLGALAQAPSRDALEILKVRLEKNTDEITLSGVDIRIRGGREEIRSAGLSRWKISRGAKGWRIQSLAAGGEVSILREREIQLRSTLLRNMAGTLPSNLDLLPARGKNFDLVATVNLRDYLIGVVAHEMPPSWPLETLKAQAVAARSYTLKTREERRGKAFHVEASIEDQVFRDASQRSDLAQVREAVTSTDGIVLLNAKGRPVKAFYHADCGGRTISARALWGPGAETGTAVDPQCPSGPGSRWVYRMNAKDFLKKVSLGGERLLGLEPLFAAEGGRAEKIRLRLPAKTLVMNANELRLKVGSTQLKSTNFEVKSEGGDLVFQGRGYGHGAGLCQWGSRYLGQQGYTSERILAHYYPKAEIGRF